MTKIAVLALVLVAEIYASSAPALLTVCEHKDGRIEYEPTLGLCCQMNDLGQGECCSFEEEHPGEADGFTPEDGCQDYSVVCSQVPVHPPSIHQWLLGCALRSEPHPMIAVIPSVPIVETSVCSGFCGPPPDRILKHLATVVLRI